MMVAFFVLFKTSLMTWIKTVSERMTLPGTREILRTITERQKVISSLSTMEKIRMASAVFLSFAKVVSKGLLYEQLANVIANKIFMALVGFDVTADLLDSFELETFVFMLELCVILFRIQLTTFNE